MTAFAEQKDEAMRIAMQYWAMELRGVVENLSEEKKREYMMEFAAKSINHKATLFIAFPELYTPDLIAVCGVTGGDPERFMDSNNKRVNVGTRMIMSYIWNHEHKLGPVHIARVIGLDHSTVIYYLRKLPEIWEGDFGFHRDCLGVFERRGLLRALKYASRVKNLYIPKGFK